MSSRADSIPPEVRECFEANKASLIEAISITAGHYSGCGRRVEEEVFIHFLINREFDVLALLGLSRSEVVGGPFKCERLLFLKVAEEHVDLKFIQQYTTDRNWVVSGWNIEHPETCDFIKRYPIAKRLFEEVFAAAHFDFAQEVTFKPKRRQEFVCGTSSPHRGFNFGADYG